MAAGATFTFKKMAIFLNGVSSCMAQRRNSAFVYGLQSTMGLGRLRSTLPNQPRGESELFHSPMGDLSFPKPQSTRLWLALPKALPTLAVTTVRNFFYVPFGWGHALASELFLGFALSLYKPENPTFPQPSLGYWRPPPQRRVAVSVSVLLCMSPCATVHDLSDPPLASSSLV